MEIKLINKNNICIAVLGSGEKIKTAQDMLDVIATVSFMHGSDCLIVKKESLSEAFFDLKTGLAGEMLQKIVNYNARLAIIGNFSAYTSKALKDFIYESNKGGHIFFLEDEALAVDRLAN